MNDIQVENQSDSDSQEDDDNKDDEEDTLERIYKHYVSINFIIDKYTLFVLFLFN